MFIPDPLIGEFVSGQKLLSKLAFLSASGRFGKGIVSQFRLCLMMLVSS